MVKLELKRFHMFPERSDRWAISYLEEERVSESRYIMAEGILKRFVSFVNCTIKGRDMKEL